MSLHRKKTQAAPQRGGPAAERRTTHAPTARLPDRPAFARNAVLRRATETGKPEVLSSAGMLPFKRQLGINFIAQYDQILFRGEFRDGIVLAIACAGGKSSER